jgi:hypothetical protein
VDNIAAPDGTNSGVFERGPEPRKPVHSGYGIIVCESNDIAARALNSRQHRGNLPAAIDFDLYERCALQLSDHRCRGRVVATPNNENLVLVGQLLYQR